MLIDSHCHLHDRETYDFAFSRAQFSHKLLHKYPDLPHSPEDFTPEKMIERAHSSGIEKMICVGTSHENSLSAYEFAKKYGDDGIFWSYGVHPDEAIADKGEKRERLLRKTSQESLQYLVAIGEVGLDYHHKTIAEDGPDFREKQIRLFEEMLQLATDLDLPLIFHVRDSFDDFFSILSNFPDLRGVVHSFSDNRENLDEVLDRGFYVGVNGLATFSSDLPLPPLERMLLETDAPFLTPAPFRGTINEPAHIKDICAYISNVKGESEQLVAKITTQNAKQLFRL